MSERITIDMNTHDAVAAMSDGNPGAINVMCMLIKEDPVAGLAMVIQLDTYDIHGSDIWLCYKDICENNLSELGAKIISGSIKDELAKLKVKYGY